MDFGALPPEINSARMYAGPGTGSVLAAATAWDVLAAELDSTASSYQSAISGLVGGPWQGPASESMNAAAAPYVAWMSATATQAEQAAIQAKAAASAYETAFAMTVPPPVIAANRAQLAALVATNVLGQNTLAIMATEAHYAQMWAQDAAAMYGYAASSAAASTLSPFPPAPQTTNPAGLAGQSAAIAQVSGRAAGTHAHTMASSMSAVPRMLQGLAQPVPSTSSTPGLSTMMVGDGASMASAAYSPVNALSALGSLPAKHAASAVKTATAGTSATAGLGGMASLLESPTGVALGVGTGVGADAGGVAADVGGLGMDFFGLGLDYTGVSTLSEGTAGGLGALGVLPASGGFGDGAGGLASLSGLGGPGASASIGQAASLGGALSVPEAWAAAVETAPMTPASALALPAAHLASATPAVPTTAPSMPKMPLVSFAGREVDGIAQRITLRPSIVPHSPMIG